MSSQKSRAAIAVEPKRQRGRLRVAAILETATAIFTEKGYDAATMTEIAARADTAIGSLYRFFPTKEVLAGALLARYAEHLGTVLDEIEARAPGMAPHPLADALIDMMIALHQERTTAIALLDTQSDPAGARGVLRDLMRRRLARILAAATGRPPSSALKAQAVVLLHLLKVVGGLGEEAPEIRDALLEETRGLARRHLAQIFATGAPLSESTASAPI